MGDKLSRIQLMNLTFWTVMGTGVLTLPTTTAFFTTQDGWISALVSSIGGFIAVVVTFIYSRIFPGIDLVESFKITFGRWLGMLAGLWYLIWLFITISIIWRELCVFVEVTVYQKTPLIIISAVLVIPISYIVYQGIQTIGMFSEFLAPLAVFFTISFITLTFNFIDWDELRPILANGWTPVLRGSFVSMTFVMEPLILLQTFSKMNKSELLPSVMLVSYLGIIMLSFMIEIASIGTLGGAISHLNYPVLEVIRNVSFLKYFIERIDTFYVMAVISVLFIKLSVFQYVFATALQQVFGLSDYKRAVWAATTCTWAGSMLLFRDSLELSEVILFVLPTYFPITLVGLPISSILGKQIKQLPGLSKGSSS